MGISYCTREDVKFALQSLSAANNAQVDRAIEAGSRSVDRLCHRKFYPEVDTRYFTWPSESPGTPGWRVWLNDHELISLDALYSGGSLVDPSGVLLEPQASGPPYNRIELNRSTSGGFSGGSTPQRDLAAIGLFGYRDDSSDAGNLATTISDTDGSMDVLDGSLVGVGDILRIEDERLIVTNRNWLSSGQQTQATLDAKVNDNVVQVSTGGSYHVGEVILLDAERMLILDVVANTLVVKRAWDGSILAAHAMPTVYVNRTLYVTRGVLGTEPATHLGGLSVSKFEAPGPVKTLAIAEAINQIQQEGGGYSATTGSGASGKDNSGGGIDGIRKQVWDSYGRKNRSRSV